MEEDHRQPNQPGQGEITISGPRTPVDTNVGVGQSVTEANLDILANCTAHLSYPKPAEFQGPGVVPMTRRVNIEHQTLAKPTEEPGTVAEPAVPVKDWDLIPTGHDVTEEAIEISSSSESESSVSDVEFVF